MGKTSFSKRLHLQASKKLGSNASAGSNQSSSTVEKPTSSSESLEKGLQLGIKIKRLHGDAFTYASICRMVLDEAGVKAEVSNAAVRSKTQ